MPPQPNQRKVKAMVSIDELYNQIEDIRTKSVEIIREIRDPLETNDEVADKRWPPDKKQKCL
jgi:hypothetical protein